MVNKKYKGLTLVELSVAMVLSVIVISLAVLILNVSLEGLRFTVNETKMQSDARLFLAEVNNNVRYANATFTVPQSSFKQDNLSPGWSYLGVMDNVEIKAAKSYTGESFISKKALVHIIPQDDKGQPAGDLTVDNVIESRGTKFLQKVLGYSYKDPKTGKEIQYDLVFNKDNPTDASQKLQYSLKTTLITPKNSELDYLSFDTALEALNSLQVIHKGGLSDPSVAIAYRRGSKDLYVAHVAMVLDKSGSMNYDMAGWSTSNEYDRRIRILKNRAKEFIDKMSENGAVDIGLFPFDNIVSVSMYGGKLTDSNIFKSAKTDYNILKERIEDLTAENWTNTGDGLRYAYYRLKDHNSMVKEPEKHVNYLILLVDGDSNYVSLYNNGSRIYTDDGLNKYSIFKNEGLANRSVELMGREYQNIDTETFFIVFANDVTSDGINTIKDAFSLDEDHIFKADNSVKLEEAFSMINKKIKQDLWYLNGPKL